MRFKSYGVAPKSAADLAFLLLSIEAEQASNK
jgi:hypothetical protein